MAFVRRVPHVYGRAFSGWRVHVDVLELAIESDEAFADTLENAFNLGRVMAKFRFEPLAIGDVDDRSEHAVPLGCALNLAGVTEPPRGPVSGNDSIVGGRRLGPLERTGEMRAHPVAILGMNETAPVGSLHDTILGWQAEQAEELTGALRHLIPEIPLERGHTASALRQAQQLLPMAQAGSRLALAVLGCSSLGDRAAEEQGRPSEHTHERLKKNQTVMHVAAGKRSGAVHGVPDRHRRCGQHRPRGQTRSTADRRTNQQGKYHVLDRVRSHAENLSECDMRDDCRCARPPEDSKAVGPRPPVIPRRQNGWCDDDRP